jgi:hypothetical protein
LCLVIARACQQGTRATGRALRTREGKGVRAVAEVTAAAAVAARPTKTGCAPRRTRQPVRDTRPELQTPSLETSEPPRAGSYDIARTTSHRTREPCAQRPCRARRRHQLVQLVAGAAVELRAGGVGRVHERTQSIQALGWGQGGVLRAAHGRRDARRDAQRVWRVAVVRCWLVLVGWWWLIGGGEVRTRGAQPGVEGASDVM